MDGLKIFIHSSDSPTDKCVGHQPKNEISNEEYVWIGEGTETWDTLENKARGTIRYHRTTIQKCGHHIPCRSMKIKRQDKLVQK
jgi:hypothetical protein